jgi:hypothetical protein
MQRVMRWMTHLNIGAALGMVAWVAWSGWQVMAGQLGTPPIRQSGAALHSAAAHQTPPLRLLTDDEAAQAHAHCHPSARSAPATDRLAPMQEKDL